MASLEAIGGSPALATGLAAAASLAGSQSCDRPVASDGSMELRSPDGRRLIMTSTDLDDILAAKPQSIVVHTDVTITDAARERLRNAGIRVTQFVEARVEVPAPIVRNGGDEELFVTAKRAIMAKLDGRADEALVDAVLRRVLASLPPASS